MNVDQFVVVGHDPGPKLRRHLVHLGVSVVLEALSIGKPLGALVPDELHSVEFRLPKTVNSVWMPINGRFSRHLLSNRDTVSYGFHDAINKRNRRINKYQSGRKYTRKM